MLEARDLTVWRGRRCLCEQLGFELHAGQALLLRGPNGTGKTTLLRVLCGLTRAETGAVFWNGAACRDGLRGPAAYGGHQPALSQELTVDQNLSFYEELSGWQVDWRAALDALGLRRCRDLQVRRLSAGQKRRAGLCRVLMSGAPLWLLDEPFTNLDSDGRSFLEAQIAAHLGAGGLAVIAAHGELTLSQGEIATLTLGVI
jgi:heme exporter protein A